MELEYKLTLNRNQMKEVYKSIELLMRLKLGQYQELVYTLCDIHDPLQTNKVSKVDRMFRDTFKFMNSDKQPSSFKDDEWKMLYDIFQVLRKAVSDAEQEPNNYELVKLSTDPLPTCTWKEGDESVDK